MLLRLPWLGAAVAAAGAGLAVWGERTFARAGTTIKPFERPSRCWSASLGEPYQRYRERVRRWL